MTIMERFYRLKDPYAFHAPGGCGADVPPAYAERTEQELFSQKESWALTCKECREANFSSPRKDRIWYRHNAF
jgi:hypothetical protein